MSDRREHLRALVVRGATEGERAAALNALESLRRPADETAAASLVTETGKLERQLSRLKNPGVLPFLGFMGGALLANLWWGWGPLGCIFIGLCVRAWVKP